MPSCLVGFYNSIQYYYYTIHFLRSPHHNHPPIPPVFSEPPSQPSPHPSSLLRAPITTIPKKPFVSLWPWKKRQRTGNSGPKPSRPHHHDAQLASNVAARFLKVQGASHRNKRKAGNWGGCIEDHVLHEGQYIYIYIYIYTYHNIYIYTYMKKPRQDKVLFLPIATINTSLRGPKGVFNIPRGSIRIAEDGYFNANTMVR